MAKPNRVLSVLEWLLDKGRDDFRVTLGCKTCKESHNLMAATARTCWWPEHEDHEVWIKNPFRKKA